MTKDLIPRLRSKHAGTTTQDAELMAQAADCIEQLQMPPSKVRELAECDEGADSLALIRALCKQIEGQRKHIATLQERLCDARSRERPIDLEGIQRYRD